MIKLLKPALAAGLATALVASPAMIAPAAAQQASIGVVDPQRVVVLSSAFQTAQQQRAVTYKAQIDQANARRQAIGAQLQPLVQKLQTDSQAANAAQNQAALQQQYNQIQQINALIPAAQLVPPQGWLPREQREQQAAQAAAQGAQPAANTTQPVSGR